jgi:hypothetical protein
MSYRIHTAVDFLEVELSGETSAGEVLGVIRELRLMDPRKEKSDLWMISPDSIVPVAAFTTIAESIARLCPADIVGKRTAVVVQSRFQKAMLDIYRSEAEFLPFEVGVFDSREQAVEWLGSRSGEAGA